MIINVELNSGGEDKENWEELVDRKIQRSLNSHKDDMLKEIGDLFKKISDSNNSSQLDKISNIMACEVPKFKRKSNEDQFKHNAKVAAKLSEAEKCADKPECKSLIAEGIDNIIFIV